MSKKIITALAWAFSGCVFLWLFSLVQLKNMSSPPTPEELLSSFVLFSFMLLGGGGCYHFFTEILSSPYSLHNDHIWSRLMKIMFTMMTTLLSAPIVMIICREYMPMKLAWDIAYFYLFVSFIISICLGRKIEPLFNLIHLDNQLNTNSGR